MLLSVEVIFVSNFVSTKEKPSEINDFRGFVLAGVVLLFRLRRTDRECLMGCFTNESLVRYAHYFSFFPIPYKNKFLTVLK